MGVTTIVHECSVGFETMAFSSFFSGHDAVHVVQTNSLVVRQPPVDRFVEVSITPGSRTKL